MIRVIKTVDAHVGGQPLRLIVEGVPAPAGKTPVQQRDWWKRHADAYRRALIFEPRGHQDMTAGLPTTPTPPQAHAGLLFREAARDPSMSGHSVFAAATIAIDRGLIVTPFTGKSESELVFDTPAGTVHAFTRTETRGGRPSVDSVAVTNVPAF